MYIPSPASKTPRFFQPCPGNDEYQLEPGMFGIKDVSGGSEAWYRPFKTSVGDANPDPILIATAADVANMVLKSTFDANTVLKADADNTPVALPVGASTILGRASTGGIAALTAAQVAAIINSSIAHNSTSGLNTGDYRHVNPSPPAGVDGWVVDESDYFAGGTKAGSVKPAVTTLIDSKTITTGAYRRVATYGNCLAVINAPTGLSVLDKNTLSELRTFSADAINTALAYIDCVNVAMLTSGGIRIFNTLTGTYIDKTVTGLGTVYDVVFKNGYLYAIDTDDDLWIIDTSDWTYSSIAVTGLATDIVAIDVDNTNTYAYVVDGNKTAAGNLYVRKIDLSDGSIDATYSYGALSTEASSSQVKLVDDLLYIKISPITGTFGSITVLTTALTLVHSDTAYLNIYLCAIDDDGRIYTTNGSSIAYSYSLPSLTLTAPRAADFTQADSFRIAAPGITGVYSASDLIRNGVLQSGALWRDRLGVSVTSVETAMPASPVDGALYLIRGGTSVYEGTVAEYIAALGWAIHTPEHGSKVTHGYFTYTYQVDRWEKTFEIVHTQELEMTTGVANPTAELYLAGVLSSGEAIVCDTCSVIATMQTASSRCISKMEAIIAYDDTDEGTQRKEIDTLTGAIGLTSVDFIIKSGNYYGGLPSDGDIQAELVMTGTPTLTRTFNVTFHIRGSVHTGLGDYCGV